MDELAGLLHELVVIAGTYPILRLLRDTNFILLILALLSLQAGKLYFIYPNYNLNFNWDNPNQNLNQNRPQQNLDRNSHQYSQHPRYLNFNQYLCHQNQSPFITTFHLKNQIHLKNRIHLHRQSHNLRYLLKHMNYHSANSLRRQLELNLVSCGLPAKLDNFNAIWLKFKLHS